MSKNITISDVIDFIRTEGWKYDKLILEEVEKLNVIKQSDIQESIEKNYNFYKEMADM